MCLRSRRGTGANALANASHIGIHNSAQVGEDGDGDSYPAYSHHDKIPPWWENVSNDEGGNVSVSKNPPYTHTP